MCLPLKATQWCTVSKVKVQSTAMLIAAVLYNIPKFAERHIVYYTINTVYKTVIKPTMTYGAECWAVTKKDENRLHVAEMRMLRWVRGNTRKDHVRNQLIQEDSKVCPMSTFLRQKRLNLYGHIRRRDDDNLSRNIMDMVVPGKRRRGRPRRKEGRKEGRNLFT